MDGMRSYGSDRSLCNENMVATARRALFTSPGLFTDTSEHIRFLRFSFLNIFFTFLVFGPVPGASEVV